MSKAIVIIPNEKILDVPIYTRDIEDTNYHGEAIMDFSNKYKLGLTPESLGIENGFYGGYVWQAALASLGHVNVNHSYPVMIYLPESLTMNQKNWLKSHEAYFKKYRKCLGYMFVNSKGMILESKEPFRDSNNYRNLFQRINASITYEANESEKRSR